MQCITLVNNKKCYNLTGLASKTKNLIRSLKCNRVSLAENGYKLHERTENQT